MNILIQLITKVFLPLFLAWRAFSNRKAQPVPAPVLPAVSGRVKAARLEENDAGSVTQYYPVVDVAYHAEGRDWEASLPAAMLTGADRATVVQRMNQMFPVGGVVNLDMMPGQPQRVRIRV